MSNCITRLRRFKFAIFATCLTLALSSVGHAQGFSIANITNNPGSKASFPTMVVDSSGNTNLAWVDSSTGLMFARSTDSKTFPSKVAVQTHGGQTKLVLPAFQPQMAVYPTQTNVIEIVWAAPDPASTPAAQLYDVFAARSNDSGANWAISTNIAGGPVALFDSPRLAFDSTGKANIVWGRNNVWISQAQDGIHFGTTPIPLMPANTPVDTGGPRIIVDAAGSIFVAWTDEIAKDQAKPGDGNFCTEPNLDPTTGMYTNTFGGNFYVNETVPSATVGGPVNISSANTRNLSNTDWKIPNPINANEKRFPNGFFGCSYDNMKLFLDKFGLVHLLWSDDTPDEDVLTSEHHGTFPAGSGPSAGLTEFSFPINLATHSASSPDVAVDKAGSFYVVWSGGPGPGAPADSEGIFFSRSDDGGSTFTDELPVAPSGAISPAFPQVAVDAGGHVNIAWEQPTAAPAGNGSDMFNVFFAGSSDKGATFPTVGQVSTSPSVLCFEAPPPPEGTGAPPTTPNVSTCGTVQLALNASSTPELAWVNQASGSAVADIDFAVSTAPTGSISPTTASLSATTQAANFTITMNPGFSGSITFSCLDADTGGALPSWLTCGFSPPTLNTSQSNTDTLTITRVSTPTSGMFVSAPSSFNMFPQSGPLVLNIALGLLSLMCVLFLALARNRKLVPADLTRGLAVMALTIVLCVGLVSCGGSTSSPSTTSTSGSGGSSGTGGGTGGGGGTTGGNAITVHVNVQAQSGSAAATTLGTVTITAQ